MKISFQYRLKLSAETLAVIEELSFHTTKLYNTVNYDLHEHGFQCYVDMNRSYADNWHKTFLHSHNYQQLLKVLEKNWKSYFQSLADYKENPSKYKGIPQPPKYKNTDDRKNEVIFTNLAVRRKEDTLILSLSKAMQEKFKVDSLKFALPKKVQSRMDFNRLQQVRLTYDRARKQWYLLFIYEKDCELLPEGYHNIMSIDPGSTNLAACCFLDNEESFLVSGKPLKSKVSHINRQVARLQGIAMSMHGSKKHRNTKAINKLYSEREEYTKDYLHKASRMIVDKAYKNGCSTIVIGDLKEIKQSMDYNKLFVQLPVRMLKDMVTYKAKLLGMQVIIVSEAYTSGCSALDMEPVSRKYYNKNRRIKRGQFLSEAGLTINADINGSLNILRRYLAIKDIQTGIPRLITSARDKGCVDNPVKLRVA